MSSEIRKTKSAPASEFSTGTVVSSIQAPARGSTRFFGRAVEHLKRILGVGGELESCSSAPLTKKAAQVGQQAVLDIQKLLVDLHDETRRATGGIQFLRTQFDHADSKLPAEVMAQYSNVPCPRHTAVTVGEGVYIHANYVGDVRSGRTFVASQYPKDFQLFWKCVTEHNLDIVDLAHDKNPYAPMEVGDEMAFGDISVRCIGKSDETDNESMYLYEVRDTLSRTTRTIRRLLFKGWPSHGTVSVPTLDALVSKLETSFSGRTLVHCSAGIGRTGTLIAAYFLKECILRRQIGPENLGVALVDLISKLRGQRGEGFVQTSEQFSLLVHFAEYLLKKMSVHDVPVREASEERCATSKQEEGTAGEEHRLKGPTPGAARIQKEMCSVDDRPFSTRVSIELTEKTPVELIQKVIAELRGTKVRFDVATKTLHLGYETAVIRALSEASPSLGAIVGVNQYTIFDDYIQAYAKDCKHAFPASGLLEEAKKYFATVSLQSSSPLVLSRGCSEQHLLSHCLEKRPGICIGECHGNSSPKDFLCEHLPFMVKRGVTTLFIEHLPSESLQDELDQFLALPEDASMPKALSTYLDYLSAGMLISKQARGYKDVIVAAKAAGIQHVVCVDTNETYTAGTNSRDGVVDLSKRLMAMNFRAAQLVEAYKGRGKYIIFAGGKHTTLCDGIPGLSQLTGCPSILIRDAQCKGEAGVVPDVTIIEDMAPHQEGALSFHFDAEIKRIPVRK